MSFHSSCSPLNYSLSSFIYFSTINQTYFFSSNSRRTAKQAEMEFNEIEWNGMVVRQRSLRLITRNKDKLTYLLFSLNHSPLCDWLIEREGRTSKEEKKSSSSLQFHSISSSRAAGEEKWSGLKSLPRWWNQLGAPLAERGCGRAAVFDFIKFNQILQLLPSLCCALSLLLLFDWIPLICFFALFASFRRSHWRCHRP